MIKAQISSKDRNEIGKIVVSGVAKKINIFLGSSGADFCCITLYYINFNVFYDFT